MSHEAKTNIHPNLTEQVRHNAKVRLVDIYNEHGWDIEKVNLSEGTVRIILEEYMMHIMPDVPAVGPPED